MNPPFEVPGWWALHGRFAGRDALGQLSRARRPGVLAGLCGMEPEALDCCARLLARGVEEAQLIMALREAEDPGAALARLLLVDWGAVERASAPPPQLRAWFLDPRVTRARRARWARLEKATRSMEAVSPQDAALCAADLVAQRPLAPRFAEDDGLWPLGEILLRLYAPAQQDVRWLAAAARQAGATDIAKRWDRARPLPFWHPRPTSKPWRRQEQRLRAQMQIADEQPYGYDVDQALLLLLDRALALRGVGEPKEALSPLGTALLLEPRLDVLRELADVQLSQGRYDEAAHALARAGSAGFKLAAPEDLGPEAALQARLELRLGRRERAQALWSGCCAALARGKDAPTPGRRGALFVNLEGPGLDAALLIVKSLQEVRETRPAAWAWQVLEHRTTFPSPQSEGAAPALSILHVMPDADGPLLFSPGEPERWDAQLRLVVLHARTPPDRHWLARLGSFGEHLLLHIPSGDEVVVRCALLELYGALDKSGPLQAARRVVRRSEQRGTAERDRPRLYLPPGAVAAAGVDG